MRACSSRSIRPDGRARSRAGSAFVLTRDEVSYRLARWHARWRRGPGLGARRRRRGPAPSRRRPPCWSGWSTVPPGPPSCSPGAPTICAIMPGRSAFPAAGSNRMTQAPPPPRCARQRRRSASTRRGSRSSAHLPPYHTVTGFRIDPVVGWISPPFELRPDPYEVAEAFEVPLHFVLDPRQPPAPELPARTRHAGLLRGAVPGALHLGRHRRHSGQSGKGAPGLRAMRLLLQYVLPFLLPFLIYAAYVALAKHRAPGWLDLDEKTWLVLRRQRPRAAHDQPGDLDRADRLAARRDLRAAAPGGWPDRAGAHGEPLSRWPLGATARSPRSPGCARPPAAECWPRSARDGHAARFVGGCVRDGLLGLPDRRPRARRRHARAPGSGDPPARARRPAGDPDRPRARHGDHDRGRRGASRSPRCARDVACDGRHAERGSSPTISPSTRRAATSRSTR